MGLTTNFGFKTLGPGESMSEDNYQFSMADRELLDSLLQATLDHHHDGTNSDDLVAPPAPTVEMAEGDGVLESGYTYEYKIAWVDEYGRESQASEPATIETPDPLDSPAKPSLEFQASGGTLSSGTHAYVISAFSGDTYTETRASLAAAITLPRGNTHAVEITIPETYEGETVTGFNVYRRRPGGLDFYHIGSANGYTFLDDGLPDDCNRFAPDDSTIGTENVVQVSIPEAPEGYTWKIYRSTAPGDWQNSFVHHVVERESELPDAPILLTYTDVGEEGLPGGPNDYGSFTFFNPQKVMLTDGAEVQGLLPVEMIDGDIGGGGALAPSVLLETLDLVASDTDVMTFADPANSEPVYKVVNPGEVADLGSRWYFQNGSDFGFGIHPMDGVTIHSIGDLLGVAKWGEAILWKLADDEYVLTGDLVAIDPYEPPVDPPEEPLMMFRMMADTFDRADAPVLGAPDDGIPVAYEYEGDGTWEVSDNSAVFTGGSVGQHTVFCDTGGFGEFSFRTGPGDVGTTSTLRVVVGDTYEPTMNGDSYLVLDENGDFFQGFGGVEEVTPVYSLTGFPGFVEGELVTLRWVVGPGNTYGDLIVTVGGSYEEAIPSFPSSPPGFGNYIGFDVDFVSGQLPKSVDFWEVKQPSSSLVVPQAFAGSAINDITGASDMGPPVEADTYNGTWEWVGGVDYTGDDGEGYNNHYRPLTVTEGDNKYTRIQFDVGTQNQLVAAAFRVDMTRKLTDNLSEIVRNDGLVLRGSASSFLSLRFGDDDGLTAPILYAVTADGATEIELHVFTSAMMAALNTDYGDGGWATARAFIGADDIFWLQINGVTESVDLSAETLPSGTDVGVFHRQVTDGSVGADGQDIGWYTMRGHALV